MKNWINKRLKAYTDGGMSYEGAKRLILDEAEAMYGGSHWRKGKRTRPSISETEAAEIASKVLK